MKRAVPVVLLLALFSVPALAVPDGWHKTLEEGKKAARVSGRPILVVTAWAPEI